MSTLRSDIRTEVRDNIQEASGATGAIWSDALLNRHITREIRSLGKKDIFLQELHTMTAVVDQQDYTLPTGTIDVEKVERNDGSSDKPDWATINGCEVYAGALWLPWRPTQTDSYRIKIQKEYSNLTDDTTASDIPDDVIEVVTWGVTVRCYKILIGYLRGDKSWDSVTKPGDLSIPVIQNWLKDAKREYDMLVKQYATMKKPRDIDLVG